MDTGMVVSTWSFFPLLMCSVIAVFQDEPFTSNEPETIFNMAKFLLHTLMPDVPNGISKVYPWLCSWMVKVGWLNCVSTVSVASGRYWLRFTGSAAYVLPRTRTRFAERGFFYSSPAAWNTLPSNLHDDTDTSTFRKRLKNVLFDRAYNWLLLALLDESYSGAVQISALIDWLIDWLSTCISLE